MTTQKVGYPTATRARLASPGAWGEVGSAADHPRHAEAAPRLRRRCSCGCGGRCSHVGMANGVPLLSGCEMRVRRWVRDGR